MIVNWVVVRGSDAALGGNIANLVLWVLLLVAVTVGALMFWRWRRKRTHK